MSCPICQPGCGSSSCFPCSIARLLAPKKHSRARCFKQSLLAGASLRRMDDGSDSSDDSSGSTTSDALIEEGDDDMDDMPGSIGTDDGDNDDLGDNNGGCSTSLLRAKRGGASLAAARLPEHGSRAGHGTAQMAVHLSPFRSEPQHQHRDGRGGVRCRPPLRGRVDAAASLGWSWQQGLGGTRQGPIRQLKDSTLHRSHALAFSALQPTFSHECPRP